MDRSSLTGLPRILTMIAACSLPTLGAGCATCPCANWCPCSTWCCKLWEPAPIAKGNVGTVLSRWDNRVRFAPDTLNNGNPIPGIAGRVYLISEEQENAQMVNAEGKIVVDLFDLTPATNGGQAKMLERWEFDRETLKRLKREDKLGNGYSLFLPWSSYRPEITQVKLHLSYTSAAGYPLYADPVAVSLRPDEPLTIHNQNIVPAQQQMPVKR